ncbi:GntR family transcriptional regulator [Planctomycetota bacterium]
MTKIEHVDLSSRVYERLKEMILTGEIGPGEKIVQEKLASAVGVSRTPLLKALQMLEHEMLVESIPRRGMYVKQMGLREIVDAFDCREGIEGIATRLTTERASDRDIQELRALFEPFLGVEDVPLDRYQKADKKFHARLIALSNNAIIKRLEVVGNIHIISYNRGLIRGPEETLSEHFAILDAIRDRDADLAEKCLRKHLRKSRNLIRESIESEGSVKTTSC